MTTSVTIVIALLILLSYVFDLSAQKTRIPTVVLLLALGWGVRQAVAFFPRLHMPDLQPLLPVLGEIGLLLIVLEGSLELEINREKKTLLRKASLSALVPIVVLGGIVGYSFYAYTHAPITVCILNALPLCVISSSMAIPSARLLSSEKRQFVIYESSLSDIFGVILFNFFTLGTAINGVYVFHFFYEVLLMLVISFAASVGLAFLLKKVDHPVKFIPIILIVFVIYTLSKEYHLPSLIFILIFGILLNNLDELKKVKFIQRLQPEILDKEVVRFREIVTELAFLVRSVFFLLFGYLINIKDLFEPFDLIITVLLVILVLIIRYVHLKLGKIEIRGLLFIAPRGLISILLFLNIPPALRLSIVSEPLMIQVILLSAIAMMLGSIFHKEKETVVT